MRHDGQMIERVESATEALVAAAPDDVAFLATDLGANELAWLALDADNHVLGGIRVNLESGPTGLEITGPHVLIDTVAVTKAEQRKGCGRALMEFVEGWVTRRCDLPQATGLGVETENTAAICLYESLGYANVLDAQQQPLTFPSTTPGKTCVVMLKRL